MHATAMTKPFTFETAAVTHKQRQNIEPTMREFNFNAFNATGARNTQTGELVLIADGAAPKDCAHFTLSEEDMNFVFPVGE